MYLLHAIFLLWAGWQGKDQVRRKRIKENILLTKRKYFDAPSASPALWIVLVSGPHWRTWTWDSGNNNCFIRCWAPPVYTSSKLSGQRYQASKITSTSHSGLKRELVVCNTAEHEHTAHVTGWHTEHCPGESHLGHSIHRDQREDVRRRKAFPVNKKKYVVDKSKRIKFIPVNLSLSKLKKGTF